MAALPCSAPDCPYTTTTDAVDNAATVQDKIAVLRIHADTAPCMAVPSLQHRILLPPPQSQDGPPLTPCRLRCAGLGPVHSTVADLQV